MKRRKKEKTKGSKGWKEGKVVRIESHAGKVFDLILKVFNPSLQHFKGKHTQGIDDDALVGL